MAEQQRSDADRQPTPAGEHLNRRNLLAALGSAGLLSTAGCLGILGDDETGPRADDPTPVPTTEGGEGTTTGPVETFDIEWTVQGATTAVASNEVLLDVAIDEGLDVPYQCEQGICGVCTSTVPGDGTDYVEHTGADYLSDEQIAGGFVLPCVASPKQDFSIETGKQDAADAYSPDGAETEETTTAADVESFSIDWTVQGATTDVPATQTLLDSALDNDLDVPYECEHGVCGECTSEVPGAGSEYVDHDGNQYLSDEQVEAGYVLTCVGSPKQDFEITTGVKDDADAV
ncbi:2Fe-2S iron-sulfur cluster-binding protein [Halodesulfurarchaeum formicicum]|uniref:2Fe-2S iron-sulfur cluster-binding protein n=1 Tax=Halodesulfurarchaeum formicicum TaxID=1873524 RepID=UPI000878FCEB|nr:2Fe-2S iron-sulfur cluster binding domain-containing protein [Halodesulfurarchaeum formicicum]